MKMVRDELFDAVHSSEYSTGAHGVQRIPYCMLVSRILNTRNDKALAAHALTEAATARVAGTTLSLTH